jgi:hypothetical protein
MPPLSGRKSVQLSMSSEFGATHETGRPGLVSTRAP